MVKLSIVILNYNTPDLVYACLKSIKDSLKLDYEIIVVDNSSNEKNRIKNAELRKLQLTAYCLLLTADNKGFGSGNNAGVRMTKGEYLLLLNPDTSIFDDSIDKMFNFIKKHEEIGALSCLMGPNKDTLQKNFFGNFQSLFSVSFRRYNYQKIDLSKEFFYTDIVTGACLMIKKELFNKIGEFDEKFFMYLEDDDLCKRIVDAGYKNAVLNTARIIHLEGKSISKNSDRKKIYYKSQDFYWQKHNGTLPTILMKIIRWPLKAINTK